MSRRRQLNAVIEEIVLDEDTFVGEKVNDKTIHDYEKLNVKCDTVISKIKDRKSKKNQPPNH